VALVSEGIPWNVVFGDHNTPPLTNAERTAMLIMLGEYRGGEFDWSTQSWRKRTAKT
jgi:hypothetical protein